MADPFRELAIPPFTAFNFLVEINAGDLPAPLCSASFSECDGLEMNMETKKIREGGNNVTEFNLNGPVTYGRLTLKRGMTETLDLWNWFEKVQAKDSLGLRGEATIVMLASDGRTPRMVFKLSGCVPVKLKAPALNAKDGQVAIEEMQVAYERLSIELPGR
jgi:phage tail-like protein